ncbi:GrpB family protein [Pseudaestuariivita sp.]|uniref:GrpB family protein n=1 Tax=Pseudaestuariivita sp. TaxID=2211669 RepID=UPI00405802B7
MTPAPAAPRIVAYDPAWPAAFADEAARIAAELPQGLVTLHHIGSTSVPGLCAKPIIDMLGEVERLEDAQGQAAEFARLGYEVKGAFGIPGRLYCRKTDAAGTRTHHLHIFETGSPGARRHLAFRNHLRANPDVAADYAALKRRLVSQQGATSESYMDGKDAFVKRVEAEALAAGS